MTLDAPTVVISSAFAAVVSAGVMRATRRLSDRRGDDGVLRLRVGVALILFGLLLIGIALRRMAGA